MSHIDKRVGKNGTYWDAHWDEYDGGKRVYRTKTFATHKQAKAHLNTVDDRTPRACKPFKALTDEFLEKYEQAVAADQREESTLKQLREHIRLHILSNTEFSLLKCDQFRTPDVQEFLERLYCRVSPGMTRKVRTTLSQIFSFGVRKGYVTFNPVRDTRIMITDRPKAGEDGETFVLPPKDDLRRLIETAKTFHTDGRAEATVCLLMYSGLRASEFLGLPRSALTLDGPQAKIRVCQKANPKNKIGRVKAKMSRRDIVLGAETVSALKRWLEVAPVSALVFPNTKGKVWSYSNLWNRLWVPIMNRAGLVTDEPASKLVRSWSRERANFRQPRFGLHMLRHVYASLQIEQGVQPKHLQVLMGHATLKLTMDTYGHLWPNAQGDQLAANVENILQQGSTKNTK